VRHTLFYLILANYLFNGITELFTVHLMNVRGSYSTECLCQNLVLYVVLLKTARFVTSEVTPGIARKMVVCN
jgi:hypothetical protein